MFLHIGGDTSVPVQEIALILDCESETPACTRAALGMKKAVEAGGTRRSMVVTADTVYYSPLAKSTLSKRLRQLTRIC